MTQDVEEAPGITLDDVWGFYESYNKSVNELTRQISYAGIALIWIFRVTSSNQVHIPGKLFLAGFFLGLTLFADYLQYIVGSLVYERYGTLKEKEVSETEKFQQPDELLWPMDALFYTKIAALLAGFFFIMTFLLQNLLAH